MASQPAFEILYPTPSNVIDFHDIVIKQRGSAGYMSPGMVEGCIEWARTDVYNFVPFPTLLKRAAATMYAYITFHPFADGNKRTSLMTTSFFFFINGYTFRISDDAPDFALETARRCEREEGHSPLEEIERISRWLKSKVGYSVLTFSTYRRVRKGLPQSATTEALLQAKGWNTYYLLWRIETTQRFAQLIGHKTNAVNLLRQVLTVSEE